MIEMMSEPLTGFPHQTDFPEHVTLWDALDYKILLAI